METTRNLPPKGAKVNNLDLKTKSAELKKRLSEKQIANFDLKVMPETLDRESRTVQLVACTNYPYLRGYYYEYEEVLVISEQAMNLDRLKSGKAPLLKDHKNSVDAVLGRIIGHQIKKADTQLNEMAPASDYAKNLDEFIVTVHFDEGEEEDRIFKKVAKGSISNVSIGYKVTDYDLHEIQDLNTPDRMIAKNWELLEVSLVAVPADPYAGARSEKENKESQIEKVDTKKELDSQLSINQKNDHNGGANPMGDENKKSKGEKSTNATPQAEAKPAEKKAEVKADPKVAEEKIREEERERAAAITQICQETGLDLKTALASKKTIAEIRKLGYEALVKKNTELATSAVSVDDSREDGKRQEFQEYFLNKAIRARGEDGAKKNAVKRDNPFLGLSLVDAMKRFCDDPWANPRKFLKEHMCGERTIGQGGFPLLIDDAMNRVLNDSYNEVGNVFESLTVTEVQNNLHTHKPGRFDIDGTPLEIAEGEDFPIVKPVMERNEIEIKKYGTAFELTEEAMLNDDLGGFDRIFMYFGRGTALREAQLIADLLAKASVQFAGGPLFSAERKNLHEDAAGGITIPNVQALRTLMRKQITPAGKPMNIFPACIICGEDLSESANSFLQSTVYPRMFGEDTAVTRRGISKIITHPYLDSAFGDGSGTDFILAASPMDGGVEIVKRIVHRDAQTPEIYSMWNTQRSSMSYFSKFYLGIGLADYRGLVKLAKQ